MSWYIEATYACFLAEIEEEQEREEKMRSTLSSKQGTLQIRYDDEYYFNGTGSLDVDKFIQS